MGFPSKQSCRAGVFVAAAGLIVGLTLLAIRSPLGEHGFRFEQQARAHCPSDTVVWVNGWSHIYHFAGNEYYGNTKFGAYMCEVDAKAAGARAAFNERHP